MSVDRKKGGINFLYAKAYLALGAEAATLQVQIGEDALERIRSGEEVDVRDAKAAARIKPFDPDIVTLRRRQKGKAWEIDRNHLYDKLLDPSNGGPDTRARRVRAFEYLGGVLFKGLR